MMDDGSDIDDAERRASSTWDVPSNPAKAVNVSCKELLLALKSTVPCDHEKQSGECPCGQRIGVRKCKVCVGVTCEKQCKFKQKASAALDDAANNDAEKDRKTREITSQINGSLIPVEVSKINPIGVTEKAVSAGNDHIAILNQKLRSSRGRGNRRPIPVEPGLPPDAGNTSQKNTPIVKTEAQFGDTVEGATETKSITCSTLKPETKKINPAVVIDTAQVLKSFAEQKSLESLIERVVRVTYVNSPNFVHVIDQEALKNKYLDLLDDINDLCLDEPPLSKAPQVGTLVCAPYTDRTMHRAIVEKVISDKFVVKFLDVGGRATVALKELKFFDKELYKIPLLGYDVLIRGVESELPLLSQCDFEQALTPWLLKQKIKISEVTRVGDTYEASFNCPNINLSEEIRRFQVWKWERLYESGKKTDSSICEDWKYSEFRVLTLSDFPSEPVLMQCSRVDLDDCTVTFTNIQVESMQKEYEVLKSQLNRYIKMIQESNHYPKILEKFLFRPAEKTSDNNWRRAMRMDVTWIYCVDTDEFFSLKQSEIETRLMCPDFLKVPCMAIQCEFAGVDKSDQLRQAIKDKFTKGAVYPIQVISVDEKKLMHQISTEPNFNL